VNDGTNVTLYNPPLDEFVIGGCDTFWKECVGYSLISLLPYGGSQGFVFVFGGSIYLRINVSFLGGVIYELGLGSVPHIDLIQ
jgi:hypothetical protein